MATDNLLDVLHQRFREALRSRQPQAMKLIYGEGAMIMPPNRAALVGHDAILAFWERARRIEDVEFEPVRSERIGDDVLRESGTMRLFVRGPGGGRRARNTTYLALWRRIDGDWRLDSIMWRRNGVGGRRAGAGAAAGGRRVNQGDGRRGNQGGNQGGGRRGNQGGGRGPGPGRQRAGGRRGPDLPNAGGEVERRESNAGFGPRANRNRADQQAPMIPSLD